mgnify:CR=1 FL=1
MYLVLNNTEFTYIIYKVWCLRENIYIKYLEYGVFYNNEYIKQLSSKVLFFLKLYSQKYEFV